MSTQRYVCAAGDVVLGQSSVARSSARLAGLLALVFLSSPLLQGCYLPAETRTTSYLKSVTGGGAEGGDLPFIFGGASSAQTLSATRVRVQWTPASDPAIVAYKVYDYTNFFNPVLLKTVKAPTSFVTLNNLLSGELYTFRVKAATADGSEDENAVDVQAIPYAGVTAGEATSSSTAVVTFASAATADTVNVYCRQQGQASWGQAQEVPNVAATSYSLTGLVAGQSYQCRVAMKIQEFEDNNLAVVSFTPLGSASQIVLVQQPSGATAGVALTTAPIVHVLDSSGNLLTAGADSSANITLSLDSTSPTMGTIRGTYSMQAVRGVADFSGKGLNLQEAGVKILRATKADTSAASAQGTGPLSRISDPFTITPDSVSPARSTLEAAPASVDDVPPLIADGIKSYVVTIALKDQYGNPVAGIRPQFGSDGSSDTLTQPAVVTPESGLVTGSIKTTVSGLKTLRINSPSGLTNVNAQASFTHGVANKLGFTLQPVNSGSGAGGIGDVKVAVLDNKGNVVNTGSGATLPIQIAIFNNSGNANLTANALTVSAANGIATFQQAGIDKTGTGYKLVATSTGLVMAYSNAFNIVAGAPSKLAIISPQTLISGICSQAFTVQIQDLGGNPASATANTQVALSGLGSGFWYTASNCDNASKVLGNLTFASGSHSKTLYFKDIKSEAITLGASSTGLVPAERAVNIHPSKVALTGPSVVRAGTCSEKFSIRIQGEDGGNAVVYSTASINLNGISGTQALVYGTSNCDGPPLSESFEFAAGTGLREFWLKDDKSEGLTLSVQDPDSKLSTSTAGIIFTVRPSILLLTGPSSVVAGRPSSVFTVKLRDSAGNDVQAPDNILLQVQGLSGTSGAIYGNAAATGNPLTAIMIDQGNVSTSFYFADNRAETISLVIADPTADPKLRLAATNPHPIAISPSSLEITAPQQSLKTSECSSAFTVSLKDGAAQTTNAIATLLVNLTGAGSGGGFYSDPACTALITSLEFLAGTSQKTFFLKSLAPAAITPLTLTATDAGSVLTAASIDFSVLPARAWVGTQVEAGFSWFTPGKTVGVRRLDTFERPRSIGFDPAKRYLYVASDSGKLMKFDYQTQSYIGWTGYMNGYASAGTTPTGTSVPSNISAVLGSQCAAMQSPGQNPGWCVGGISAEASGWEAGAGGTYTPAGVAANDNYVFVANWNSHIVSRYRADTGAFAGWIGRVNSTNRPSAPGEGSIDTLGCTSVAAWSFTPGWCRGGLPSQVWGEPDQGMTYPKGLAVATVEQVEYLYVGQAGAVMRFNAATGQRAGWIGLVGTLKPTSTPGDQTHDCVNQSTTGQVTPGWCSGGNFDTNHWSLWGHIHDLSVRPGVVDASVPELYVLSSDRSNQTFYLRRYDLKTGAFLGSIHSNTYSSLKMVADGANLYTVGQSQLNRFSLDAVTPANSGILTGWVGKVNSSPTGGATGCNGLAVNQVTPGWCTGGSRYQARAGLEANALYNPQAIVMDGQGKLLVVDYSVARISKFDPATGAFEGMVYTGSESAPGWSISNVEADATGYDDSSLGGPSGLVAEGAHLYVAQHTGKIAKILKATGEVVGAIGGMLSSPTGGATGCLGANSYSYTPGWCLGALFQSSGFWGQIPASSEGLIQTPRQMTSDGTYLYLADQSQHRISRYRISDGAYMGWIGGIQNQAPFPLSGSCTGIPGQSSTQGWCKGGTSTQGSADGFLNQPSGIYHKDGYLYITDNANNRVVRYGVNGQFQGWIGKINTGTPTGCVPSATNFSGQGWCMGASAQYLSDNSAGGGFGFSASNWQYISITGSGNQLFISNHFNSRIDVFTVDGVFVKSVPVGSGSNAWATSNHATWNGTYSRGVFADGSHLYYVWGNDRLFKRNQSNGNFVGWQGGITPGAANAPSGGDPGCAGANSSTPGWCTGGSPVYGTRLGMYWDAAYIAGDDDFIYVSDATNNRVVRLPK